VVFWDLSRVAAIFLFLFSDHDWPSFHQLTVPKVKPGFALSTPGPALASTSLSPAPSPSTRENLVIGHFSVVRAFSLTHTRVVAGISLQ
jgi:hypothetical protein